MKKALFVIDRLDIGGTEKQLVLLLNNLDRSKIKPFVVMFYEKSELLSELKEDVAIRIIPVRKVFSFHGLKCIFELKKYLKEMKIDVVFTYFYDAVIVGVWSSLLAGVKRVYICRRDMGFWYSSTKLFILRFLVNPFASKFIANSRQVASVVKKKEGVSQRKMITIHNGFQIDKEKAEDDEKLGPLSLPQNKFIVGIVSNLNREVKRVDILLEAAQKVLNIDDGFYFVVIGGGSLENSLKDKAQKLGIIDSITFLGRHDAPQEVMPLFNAGVNTSETEGLSNSLIEMMFLGVPVVASKTSGNEELIEHEKTGLLFENLNSSELASCLLKLKEDESLRLKLSENAKENARANFSLETYLKSYEALIEDE